MFGGPSIKEPSDFELTLLTRVVIPLLLIGLCYMLINLSNKRNKCETACEEQQYSEYSYIPKRYTGDSCYCYAEGNSKERIQVF